MTIFMGIVGKTHKKLKAKKVDDSSDESEDDDDEDDDEDMQVDDSDENSDTEDSDDEDESDDDSDSEETSKSKKSVKQNKKTSDETPGKKRKLAPEEVSDKKTAKKSKPAAVPVKGDPVEDNSNRTLFVSRLKKGVTNDQLKTFVVSKGFAVVDCRKVAQAAFGFVQFATITELDMAVSTLQNVKFGDTEINVARSKPPGTKKVEQDAKTGDKTSTVSESRKAKKSKQREEKKKTKHDKLSVFVKNIGQSITKELLQQQFAGVKKIVIAKKLGGATRG